MARGVGAVRRVLRFNPLAYAGMGVLLAGASGFIAMFFGTTFLTAHWLPGYLFGVPGAFDIGVYLVVFGTMTAIALALEDEGEGE
jgi:multicomponent Na+:H+ antiporter subunit B